MPPRVAGAVRAKFNRVTLLIPGGKVESRRI
jgi:hypothetical protein